MLYRERASVVATLVVLGLILAAFLQFPTWSTDLTVLGSPLTISISQTALMAALLVGITCAGTDSIVRSHPAARRIEARYSFVTWTLPGLTVLLATVLLPQLPTQLYQLAGLVATGLILILVISAEYDTVDPTSERYLASRLSLNAWAYLVALAVFVLIYSAKARSLLSATGVTVVSTLLALEFLRSAGRGFGRTALYAAIAGPVHRRDHLGHELLAHLGDHGRPDPVAGLLRVHRPGEPAAPGPAHAAGAFRVRDRGPGGAGGAAAVWAVAECKLGHRRSPI